MVYNSRSQEEDSARERKLTKERENRYAEKSLEFAKKIADFLQKSLGGSCVAVTKTGNSSREFKKINLVVQDGNLTVQHRGYDISANCDDPSSLSAKFRNWLPANMSHASKVEPRAN